MHERKITSNVRYKKALEMIKNEKLVVDSICLPLIEAAESGDRAALHKLHSAFKFGEFGLQKNYSLSLHYLNQLREQDGDDELLKFYSTRCLGDTHYKFGNFEEAQTQYSAAAKIMMNLPNNEWDFEMLQTLEGLLATS